MLRNIAAALTLITLTSAASAQQQPWPPGSAQRFVLHCAGLHKELIEPCRCTITGVMKEISAEEFVKLSNAGTIEQDARYKRIYTDCATRPQVRR